ncbi:cobalt-precorrin 5A hydrolase [Tepidamorphus gemmatus]|uniref:Cobalt-precorrin 5A hydrolase n=2 Tax=Tepidamorphus gemmatus TaxID=747076 RepID=A0A4R3MLA4_9HYPH|nr:cobalt-precorrin 5A hydrolase [Tepidamorphus gemmatus]
MIVAGIGCRRGCTADEIVALVRRAMEEAGAAHCRLTALAAPSFKRDEPGLRAAADILALPLFHVGDDRLTAVQADCPTRSASALAATGQASIAEAAALAAAGPGGRLVLARIKSAAATCALAERRPR